MAGKAKGAADNPAEGAAGAAVAAMGKRGSDDILADLHARWESMTGPTPAVDYAAGSYLRQQITAHETLARLRDERATAVEEGTATIGIDASIAYWLTMADENPADTPMPATVLVTRDAEGAMVTGGPVVMPSAVLDAGE